MSQQRTLRIAYGGHSAAGVKARNEDAFAALLPAGGQRQSKGAVAVLADGAGCSDNAQQASQTSVVTFIQDYFSTPESWDVRTSAGRVLSALNSWLFRQSRAAQSRQDGYVTTFSALVLHSTTAHLLHCGDSRLWRRREHRVVQLSTDHVLQHEGGNSVLTRALGMDSELKVDYQQRSLRVGDLWMLTSDGVHGVLKADELAQLLDTLTPAGDGADEGCQPRLERLARTIVQRALASGSTDNLSCLLLEVLELPLEALDEAQDRLQQLVIPPVLAPGNRIDDYTVQKVLHSGARSHVYLVTHPRFRQKFVLKAPSPNFSEDAQYLDAFLREQWVGRRIDHPSVMKIHDPVPDSRFLYHICDYIEGSTLRQWMYDHPQPDLATVRELAKQIATSLRVLQRLGMLHRDLKPENLMVTPQGQVKLIDFGTVLVGGLRAPSASKSDEVPVGTADYIAPECVLGAGGEHRSDIYSLGVIVYELLTGGLPYQPPSPRQYHTLNWSHWRYRSACELRADLPVWLDLALRKACAPHPDRRHAALSELLHDLAVPNPELIALQQQRPLIERHPVRVWQAISALLLALLIVQAWLQ
jgi:serine/threonine protein phosphatase PrpC